MKTSHRSNALLVELLIVVMFFMLSATILLQVFSKARTLDMRAEREADAVAQAQDLADQLWAAEDADALLTSLGFTRSGDTWEREADSVVTRVTAERQELSAGVFLRSEVQVLDSDGTALVTLPCSRYREVSP